MYIGVNANPIKSCSLKLCRKTKMLQMCLNVIIILYLIFCVMKRILSFMLGFLISGSFVFGQINLFGPGSLKLIEKGKFVDAEKKINKDLQKTPDYIETNYTMALLLLNRNYTSYNTEKSYEYLTKCIKLFKK